MPTVLVTGANRGIGLEFARQYKADGWRVIATCRHPAAAADLKALGVEVHALDVGDFDAITRLAAGLAGVGIDHLINNAGVYGERQSFGSVDAEEWMRVMRINAMAPLKMAEAFVPSMPQGGVVAVLSSKMGSMGDNTSGGAYIYRSSKAALNAVAKNLSADLKGRGILVAAFHPGWVRTAMGGPHSLISAAESVGGMRRIIAGLAPDASGGFFAYDGTPIPW